MAPVSLSDRHSLRVAVVRLWFCHAVVQFSCVCVDY